MHDLIVLLAFFGIVFAPAIVAANTVAEADDGYRHDFDPADNATNSTKSVAETMGR
ncbi:MAG: hypothetical protein ACLQLH_08855 [Terracidiphilus sp.]|jgi:hypothetical protein